MKIWISLMFFSFFLVQSPSPIFADEALIEDTCKKTPYYDLCVSSLKSDSQSGSADVLKLAEIMVDIIAAKASDVLNHVNELLKSSKDPHVQQSLKECVDDYNGVVQGDVPQAVAGLTKGDYKFAEQAANDAANEADYCEKAFSGLSSPITDMNKNMHDLSVVAASIVRILMSS